MSSGICKEFSLTPEQLRDPGYFIRPLRLEMVKEIDNPTLLNFVQDQFVGETDPTGIFTVSQFTKQQARYTFTQATDSLFVIFVDANKTQLTPAHGIPLWVVCKEAIGGKGVGFISCFPITQYHAPVPNGLRPITFKLHTQTSFYCKIIVILIPYISDGIQNHYHYSKRN